METKLLTKIGVLKLEKCLLTYFTCIFAGTPFNIRILRSKSILDQGVPRDACDLSEVPEKGRRWPAAY